MFALRGKDAALSNCFIVSWELLNRTRNKREVQIKITIVKEMTVPTWQWNVQSMYWCCAQIKTLFSSPYNKKWLYLVRNERSVIFRARGSLLHRTWAGDAGKCNTLMIRFEVGRTCLRKWVRSCRYIESIWLQWWGLDTVMIFLCLKGGDRYRTRSDAWSQNS